MRLWSIHPKYLDTKGLVALWREGLLAQSVLLGKTKGYKHHPQLIRFQERNNPTATVSAYLHSVADEGDRRGYQFNRAKIVSRPAKALKALQVPRGQLQHEFNHLKEKLKTRDPIKLIEVARVKRVQPHPLFGVIPGAISQWEKTRKA